MRATLVFLVAGSLLASRSVATAGAPAAALSTPAEIDKACDAAEMRADKHKDSGRFFGEVTPDDAPRTAAWRSFPSHEALDHATPDGPPNTQAMVWPAVNGVVYVAMFFTSESGDWAQFADLCYRPDGSLARTVDTLNSFYGGDEDRNGVSRVHILLFDAAGKIIQKRSRLLDLQTRKPVKRAFGDEKDRIFKRLTDLPFSPLLSQASQ
jgi:hypothetical protein